MPHCPVCRIQITQIPYEGIKIFNCEQCGGNWLTGGQIERILASREIQMPPAVQEQMSMLAAASNTTKRLLCIQCGVTMKKEPFKFWPEVQLDHCPKCNGIWFDRGELEKVQILWERYRDDPSSLPNHELKERGVADEVALKRACNEEVEQVKQDAVDLMSGVSGSPIGSAGYLIGFLLSRIRPGAK